MPVVTSSSNFSNGLGFFLPIFLKLMPISEVPYDKRELHASMPYNGFHSCFTLRACLWVGQNRKKKIMAVVIVSWRGYAASTSDQSSIASRLRNPPSRRILQANLSSSSG